MSDSDILDNQQVTDYLVDLPDWRLVDDALRTVFETKTAALAIELFGDIAAAAETDNHHPDVDWRYNRLFVSITSHDVGSVVTTRDIALATKITERAEARRAITRTELI
ncbi:4a-hydroxytetrahydrobiopterin dehydratase [Glutamicibacter sp. JC586]|uniref:4a-hydroxytetrahydrobiopterin dehydratase n=1 Tax=Glutamicibacter sp. JC586 TaxID=2590552 RepID=UPI00135B8A9A|nr:4a-hydroxytetrahydrobiopterin dehydratase [Glutamicibacter sp. JC586]